MMIWKGYFFFIKLKKTEAEIIVNLKPKSFISKSYLEINIFLYYAINWMMFYNSSNTQTLVGCGVYFTSEINHKTTAYFDRRIVRKIFLQTITVAMLITLRLVGALVITPHSWQLFLATFPNRTC